MRSTAKPTSALRTHSMVRVLLFVLALVLVALATTSAQKFEVGNSFATRGKRITTAGLAKVANVPTSATITSISPSQGPIAGGTQVTLTGSGFIGTTLTLYQYQHRVCSTRLRASALTSSGKTDLRLAHR